MKKYVNGAYVDVSAEEAAALVGDISELRERAVAKVKKLAQAKIYEIVPLWKQNNLTARGLELSLVQNLTTEQQAEQAAITNVWDQVKAVRNASNQIEAKIAGLSAAELETYNPITESLWPGGSS